MAMNSQGNPTPAACHPVDEKLPAKQLIPAAFQHVGAMYAGVVAPPLIIGPACGLDQRDQIVLISVSLLVAGLATLLQTLGAGRFAGNRLPFVNASSSAGLASLLTVAHSAPEGHRIQTVLGAVLVGGLFCLAVGPFFGRLMRFFPHLVTGVVITLIGVSLMTVPVAWVQGGEGAPDFGSAANLGLALFTLVVIIVLQRVLRGFLKQIALILGLVAGTLAAAPFGMLDTTTFEQTSLFALPMPLQFGAPEFHPAAILAVCIVILVAMTESSAGMLAIGEICDRDVEQKLVTRGLRVDGIATTVGSLFGGLPTSAFAQNVGVVSLTGVRSRFVVAVAGGVMALLGLFPVLGGVVSLVPYPVLGGAGLMLFGSIATSGIRTLSRAHLEQGHNMFVVSVSLAVGLIPLAAPTIYQQFPQWFQTVFGTGIVAGAIVAVVLNMIFNSPLRATSAKPVQRAAAPEPAGGGS
ncbi:purine permease [Saccharopolyspora hirsuta]|uniref:Purine permease n=1 Tax=Saccharopolyspora hirsuta TaxID=1837 RepID=A0A5M7BR97_SACHI|nr:nucleobase:cation symporter-2 family protein [Saccharopolyspora hirsuta]KAA5830668.1 purine permease [Saccharopolyspora hirsuta]